MGKRMINYSVFMMANPLDPSMTEKAYARNQVSEVWSLEKFSKHIASHNGVYSRGTVKGVLADMCECLVEQLLNGNRIQLGELGTFGVSISCEGAESIEKFTSKNIKAVNILFIPGADFENLVDKAEFNCVASRVAQEAVLKAEKAGAATLDLASLKKKDTTSAEVPSEGNTGDDNTDSGSTDSGNGGSNGGSNVSGGEDALE